MAISKNKAVTIHYEVSLDDGNLIDKSEPNDPLAYLHGHNNIVPGLEKALEGKKVGDKVSVTVTPEDGYGERDEALVQSFPLSQFDEPENVKPGASFQVGTPQGVAIAVVQSVDEENATVDLNHPLADKTLKFKIEIIDVRDASDEELEHGHVHGVGGHHHHDHE